jgi:hypothetical protein
VCRLASPYRFKNYEYDHTQRIKGSPVHVAPACTGSRERSDHFGSYVRSLSLHFYKRLFPVLEPMTSWSQGNRCARAPLQKGSPVHVAPACAGSGGGSDYFGSYVRSFSLHFFFFLKNIGELHFIALRNGIRTRNSTNTTT